MEERDDDVGQSYIISAEPSAGETKCRDTRVLHLRARELSSLALDD